jgi:hypothetical protein
MSEAMLSSRNKIDQRNSNHELRIGIGIICPTNCPYYHVIEAT